MKIKEAIIKVFSANFLQLIAGIIVGFVIPVVLSIEGYAEFKTYMLYISYIGFFHFGFIDGLYIKYGGKEIKKLNKQILKGEHNFLIVFELIITIIVFFLSLILKNVILLLLAISILPTMIASFHKYLNQATGDFKTYSNIMYVYTLIYMTLNVVLAIFLKSQNYIWYCLTMVVANILSILMVELKFLKKYKNVKPLILKKDIINIIKVGFFILLGNLAVIGLFGIDKWFVKLFLTTEDFAYYSFAVSMLNIINTLVNAISVTFYNYLFTNNNEENINKLKKYLITLGGFASLGYFALSFIVNYFIKKYIPSLSIIAVTFAVFPYMILINALYVNLYKVNKNEKKYFKVVISILLISIIYNIIAIIVFKNTTSIAFATILTLITWVVYSTYDLENVTSDTKMYIYMFCLTTTFLLCSQLLNWLIGGVVYFIIFMILTFVFEKEVIDDCYKILMNFINRH